MKFFIAAAAIAVTQVTSALNVHDFPKTSFSCRDKNSGEYYADPELGCQVYHICAQGQFNRLTKMSFACPNGTLFSQSSRICNSEDKVYCPLAERYYDNVQGTIDTHDDYRNVFKLDAQPVFPLEPSRKRRPEPQQNDYDDDATTAAPRRQSNRRQPARQQVTTTTQAPRQRPPQRQFTPIVPTSQFEPQPPQDFRPPAGGFTPPRPNSRPAPPASRPTAVNPPPVEYAAPQRGSAPQRPPAPQFAPGLPPPPPPASRGPPAPPPAPAAPQRPEQNQAPNRLVVTRPNIRRPNPLGPQTTTPAPAPTTTLDPNAEYEYYDYEETPEGQQNPQQQN